MGCIYCDNPNIAFAGKQGESTDGMCEYHARRHRIMVRIFSSALPQTRMPRWRYFEHNDWWYCWTTERMDDGKFAAFIYRPDGDDHVLVKEVKFAQRQKAKAKAGAWAQRAKQSASGRLPAAMLR